MTSLETLLAAGPAPAGGGGLPHWLLDLLSIDTERLQGGTEHVRFARFPEGGMGLVALLLVAAGFVVVFWLYHQEGQLPRVRKIALATLRCLLLAATAAIIFYPVLEVDRAQELRASTIVLIDESLSQGIKDRYQGDLPRREALARALGIASEEVASLSRADLAGRALARNEHRVLTELARKNHLKAYAFSSLPLRPLLAEGASTPAADGPDAARGAAGGPPPAAPIRLEEIEPRGTITDIAGALRTAVEAEAGGKAAAIVLLTDGRVTAGEDLKSAAAFLKEKGIPVHAVGIGDPTPTRNFRVTTVLASERVFKGDPVAVDVRIDQRGFDGETARVELLDVFEAPGDAPGAPTVVEAKDVTFATGRAEASASFRFEPKGIGRHRLTARIEPRPEEAFADDNERTATVEVAEEASKVLLIAGGPSYEYRFLKNLLRRDSRIHVAAWLMSADPDFPQEGDESLKRLPDTPKDLFQYDVIILMDVDPQGFAPGFLHLVEEFVGKERGGLIYSAGSLFSPAFFESPESEPIRAMLPVLIDAAEAKDEAGRAKFYDKEWPLEPTPSAQDHAATRLSSQIDRNREIWAEIAGIYWSFPVRKAKAGATVLFVHPDPSLARDGAPRPIAAAQLYEGGRVIWCGLDSTWRWRSTAEEVYDRFWIQTIRFLTESRLLGGRRRLVDTDQETYDLGEAMRISALLKDEAFRPVDAEEAIVMVEGPEGTPTEVRLQKDEAFPGWFRGMFVPRAVGSYRIRLESDAAKTVAVAPPALEFEEPRLDEPALQELGSLTGGSYSPLAEIDAVPDRIEDKRQTIVTTDEPIPLWDNWLSMCVLAGLLAVEWILRKWNRLL
jgi:hypothetical protein